MIDRRDGSLIRLAHAKRMFEEQQSKSPAVTAPPAKAGAVASDILIHSMPKEFFNREAKLKEDEKIVQVAVTAPIKPKPIVMAPAKKRSKRWLVIWSVIALLVLGGGGLAVAYVQGWLTPTTVTPTPEPTPTPTPTPTPVPTPTPTPEPATPLPGADTDSDGLSNVEELMYGTDFRDPDSDGDSYLDGNEVFHRFDPRGLAPSTLLDTGAVKVLSSTDLPFTIFFPSSWNPVSTPASQRVSFRSATGALVNVLWVEKTPDQTLAVWYDAQVGDIPVSRLQTMTTKEGYSTLLGADERVVYLDAGSRVYTLIYDLGTAKSIEFLQTFKMMTNSFKLVP